VYGAYEEASGHRGAVVAAFAEVGELLIVRHSSPVLLEDLERGVERAARSTMGVEDVVRLDVVVADRVNQVHRPEKEKKENVRRERTV